MSQFLIEMKICHKKLVTNKIDKYDLLLSSAYYKQRLQNLNNIKMQATRDRQHTPPNKQNLPSIYNRSASPTNINIKNRIKIRAPKQIRNIRTTYQENDRKIEQQNVLKKQKFMDFFNTKKNGERSKKCGSIGCSNHDGKEARFSLEVDGDVLYYCLKCAVKLASQGFLVNKLQQEVIIEQFKPQISKHGRQKQNIHNRSSYSQPQFEQNLQHTLKTYSKTIEILTEIDNTYRTQYKNTQNYYTQLIQFMEQLKYDNLAEIQQQWRKNSQISHIQCGYLYDNLDQMYMMKQFTEQQWGNQQQRNMRVKFYKQKLDIFLHKIQQIQQFISKTTSNLQQQVYHNKLSKIQQYLLTKIKPSLTQHEQGIQEQQTMINILPTQSHYEVRKKNTEMMINPVRFMKMCENRYEGQCEGQQEGYGNGRKVNAFRRLFGGQDVEAN